MCALCACGRIGFDATDRFDVDGPTTDTGPADLVLHVGFDSDGLLRDRARGHTLTCSSCPLQVGGQVGEAAMFDGTNCILVGDAVDLRPAVFTFSAWGASVANEDATIVGRPLNGATTGDNTFQMFVGGNLWRLGFNGGGRLMTTATAGAWHHVAGTFDGATLTMYVDGTAITGTTVGAAQYANDDLMIGCDRDVGAVIGLWRGLIDEVRLYARPLSAAEVAVLAQP